MLNRNHCVSALAVLLGFTVFASAQGTLEKTVSLEPGAAGSGAITVTAGTTVYYTYFLRNGAVGGARTGGLPITDTIPVLTFHTLTDDKLGLILDQLNMPLQPGQVLSVTQSAVINQTTTNTAEWFAFAEPLTNPFQTLAAQVLVFTSTASATVFVAAQQMELPVPTLSEWGVVSLTVLLLGTGMLVLRRSHGAQPPVD